MVARVNVVAVNLTLSLELCIRREANSHVLWLTLSPHLVPQKAFEHALAVGKGEIHVPLRPFYYGAVYWRLPSIVHIMLWREHIARPANNNVRAERGSKIAERGEGVCAVEQPGALAPAKYVVHTD